MSAELAFDSPFNNGELSFVIVGLGHDFQHGLERFECRLLDTSHEAYLAFHSAVACHFGTGGPLIHIIRKNYSLKAKFHLLLTRNLSSSMMYGYGDPAVVLVREAPFAKPGYYGAVDVMPVERPAVLNRPPRITPAFVSCVITRDFPGLGQLFGIEDAVCHGT